MELEHIFSLEDLIHFLGEAVCFFTVPSLALALAFLLSVCVLSLCRGRPWVMYLSAGSCSAIAGCPSLIVSQSTSCFHVKYDSLSLPVALSC